MPFALIVLMAAGLFSAAPGQTCDTPVYRYALQNWPPDDYEVVIVHRGGGEAADALNEWRSAAAAANVVVREVDLTEGGDFPYPSLLEEEPLGDLPWVYLRYPVRGQERRLVWSGPWEPGQAARWTDSSLRRTISQELLADRAGVWLFLESGDRRKDEAAATLLSRELKRLEQTLPLPCEVGTTSRPLSFVTLRLPHGETAEESLRTLLLGSEPDLDAYTNEAMVFPIYGRGIVLYALVGRGINEQTITEAAEFLAGPCACEIKSQNPGLELLMRAEWEGGWAEGAATSGFFERAEEAREQVRQAEEKAFARLRRTASASSADESTEETRRLACPLVAAGCTPIAILLLASAGILTLVVLRYVRRESP